MGFFTCFYIPFGVMCITMGVKYWEIAFIVVGAICLFFSVFVGYIVLISRDERKKKG